jgi:hypothetical protein
VWKTGELHTRLLWGGLKERIHFEDLGVDRWIILKWIFKRWDAETWVELTWLRTGTGGGLF